MSPVVEEPKRQGCRGCLTHPVTLVLLALVLAMTVLLGIGLYQFTIGAERRAKATQDVIADDLATLVKALRDYRDLKGHYPARLSQILGVTLKAGSLPRDPYSEDGSPYIYYPMHNNEYIIVYSVGPDGVDNDGERDIARCVEPEDGDVSPMLLAYLQMEKNGDDPDNGIGKIMQANLKAFGIVNNPLYAKLTRDEILLVLRDGWSQTARQLHEQDVAAGVNTATDPLADLRRLLEWNQPIAELIHEGVSAPTTAMKIDERNISYISPIPNFLAFQVESKLLCAEGALLEAEGKPEEAMEKYFDALGWGRAAGTQGSLIAVLINVAIDGIALPCMQRCLVEGDLDEDTLLRTIERLRRYEATEVTMASALMRESAMFHKEIEKVGFSTSPQYFGTSLSGRAMQFYVVVNKSRILRNNEIIYEGMAAQCEGKNPGFDVDAFIKQSDYLHRIAPPNFVNAGIRQNVSRAKCRATQIIAALVLYEKQHGSCPASLEDLRDILGDSVTDPFGGAPFVYDKTPEGFVLYSLGPNERDDMSSITYDPTNGTLSTGDILFNDPRTQ